MGANESKPSTGLSPHMWKASSPASISSEMAESLQSSPETDASRARLTEAQIQARVSEELKKLQSKGSETLKQALAAEDDRTSSAPAPDSISRQTVNKEIEALRSKLEERRQVRDLPEGVQRSRDEVVKCLTEHDRRPLDCYLEVEAFKKEVRNWEKGWVEKVIS